MISRAGTLAWLLGGGHTMGGTLQEDSVIMELECERANLVLIDRKHT